MDDLTIPQIKQAQTLLITAIRSKGYAHVSFRISIDDSDKLDAYLGHGETLQELYGTDSTKHFSAPTARELVQKVTEYVDANIKSLPERRLDEARTAMANAIHLAKEAGVDTNTMDVMKATMKALSENVLEHHE